MNSGITRKSNILQYAPRRPQKLCLQLPVPQATKPADIVKTNEEPQQRIGLYSLLIYLVIAMIAR